LSTFTKAGLIDTTPSGLIQIVTHTMPIDYLLLIAPVNKVRRVRRSLYQG